jgi:hypothetical protein
MKPEGTEKGAGANTEERRERSSILTEETRRVQATSPANEGQAQG